MYKPSNLSPLKGVFQAPRELIEGPREQTGRGVSPCDDQVKNHLFHELGVIVPL